MIIDRVDPIWTALAREAAIAAESLATGATLLGKANYAHHAHYGQSFFALSIGLERAAKLALVVDYAASNGGTFPANDTVRKYGHDLAKLLERADQIADARGATGDGRLPRSTIHNAIVSVLTDFATNVTRYYNLELVTAHVPAVAKQDPIAMWFEKVVEPILGKHYTQRHQIRHGMNAKLVSKILDPIAVVRFTSEQGASLDNAFSASMQTAMTDFAKPLARMYVLHFARFFSHLFTSLTHAAHAAQVPVIPYLSEFFAIFDNDDTLFRRRKTWSIYHP